MTIAIFGIAGPLPTFFISWFLLRTKISLSVFCTAFNLGDRHDVTIKKEFVMSRTLRRKNQQHDYDWVLIDWNSRFLGVQYPHHDSKLALGQKAIARYHSDSQVKMGCTAPRSYRKAYDHRLRTQNNRQMRKWLEDPEFDPVFEAYHRHDANYSWW